MGLRFLLLSTWSRSEGGDAYVASGTALRLVWDNQGLTTQRKLLSSTFP
ncbi:nucleoside diphosphate kinase [Corchorus olitorius]|uniref:Nucleoside diphosphate kinase n=1 Tax=Corchorus olitorius TaxID=93759 RepID=A0A1R3JHA3_9ROSI|nr:nucleoside diphosphate kinase [Corchorus olitorius]